MLPAPSFSIPFTSLSQRPRRYRETVRAPTIVATQNTSAVLIVTRLSADAASGQFPVSSPCLSGWQPTRPPAVRTCRGGPVLHPSRQIELLDILVEIPLYYCLGTLPGSRQRSHASGTPSGLETGAPTASPCMQSCSARHQGTSPREQKSPCSRPE